MLLNEYEMEYNDSFLININDTSLDAAGATIVSPVLMFLAGVGGNILALVILYRRRNDVRTIKFYHLIKGLVWTDLLGILFTTPSVLASYFNHRQWVGGDVHCRLHGLVMACFGMATPFIICAMAFERFLALKCVFFYSSRCTSGIAKGCILAVWIFVFAYCILPFIGFGKFEKQYPGTWCFFDFHSSKIDEKVYGYIYASINLLLILLMITCNAHVVYTLARTRFKRRYTPNRRESAVMSHMALTEQEVLVSVSRHTRKPSRDLEIHMIVFLCALTSVFTICWAPFMVHIMSTLITGKQNLLLDLAAVRLASLNQTLDPWLYILLRRSLFVALKKKVIALSNVVRCFYKQNNTHSRDSEPSDVNKPDIPLLLENGNRLLLDCAQKKDMVNESQPDVMLADNSLTHSAMPDVLPIGKLRDLGCVCQVYLNTNQFASMNNGVYVKVLYLHGNQCNNDGDNGQPCGCEKDNSRSTVCHNFTPINLSAIMKVAKTESLLMPQRIYSLRLPGKNRKRTDSFLQVKNDECSSNGRRKTLHESLRRSKSNSTTA